MDSEINYLPDDNDYTKLSNAPELLELRKKVSLQILLPHYEKRIINSIDHISSYSFLSTFFYTLSSIVTIISTILSFSNIHYEESIISIVSGSLNIFAIILKEYGVYCQGREKQNSLRVNELLRAIGMKDNIPDLSKFNNPIGNSPLIDGTSKSNSFSVNMMNTPTISTSLVESINDVDNMLRSTSNEYTNLLDTDEIINLRKKIILEIILPHYEKKIHSFIDNTVKWGTFSIICYTFSSFMIGLSSIVSFINQSYEKYYLSLISGILSLFAVFIKEFGQFAQRRDKQNSSKVNVLLKTIGLKSKLPDLSKYNSIPIGVLDTNTERNRNSIVKYLPSNENILNYKDDTNLKVKLVSNTQDNFSIDNIDNNNISIISNRNTLNSISNVDDEFIEVTNKLLKHNVESIV